MSIGSSLVSLAERGSITPARQRTVTEVVWPENMIALNSGLRSRLNSSTSLVRAGSQKSVAYESFVLSRRESQRSVSEYKTQSIPAAPMVEAANATSSSVTTGGWRSEQGSPRRPASLVLSESMHREWMIKAGQSTSESLHGSDSSLHGLTPVAPVAVSPIAVNRFSTTNVEVLTEQVSKYSSRPLAYCVDW